MIPLLKIKWDIEGIFLNRANRYLAYVEIDGKIEPVHVHDPGRLKELLYKGNRVLLKRIDKKGRKTKYDVVAAYKEGKWVLVHSGYHRKISEVILKKGVIQYFKDFSCITPETKLFDSRIDFRLTKEKRTFWLEVKGCTLAINGVALFPDAPTERGLRHLKALMKAAEKGDEAGILVLVFRSDAEFFSPNFFTHKEFAEVFYIAVRRGVKVFPSLLEYRDDTLFFKNLIPVMWKCHV